MYAWVIKCPDGKYVGYEFEDILFVTPCILNGAHWVSKEAAQIEIEIREV